MVATRGQGRKRSAQQVEEPSKNDYERRRDARVAENNKLFEALGLKTAAAQFNNSLPQSANDKGKKSGNKKTSSDESDSSEYLLDDDDQGDSDDDDSESNDQPRPLATKYPPGFKPIKHTPNKKKIRPNMAPGGRGTKRVSASQASEVQPTQAQTRSSKRLHHIATEERNADDPTDGHDELHQRAHTGSEESNGGGGQDSTAAEEDSATGAQDSTPADEDNVAIENDTEAPTQRAPRAPRPPTKGAYLDRMTKAMGHRLPIAIAPGNKRPHEPVQAAKFASESGVVIRDKIPILPHWKSYKNDDKYYKEYVSKLSGRLAINDTDKPTEEACTDILRTGVRQRRYRLKKKYFDGLRANEILTTSPVACMSDAEWNALTAKWSNPKNMETSAKNKTNRSKVKYHQTTGSRNYRAHLHAYKQNRNNAEPSTVQDAELDVVEAFQTCHTSSKKGLSESAREALSNMEALRAAPVAEGETGATSVQVVSQTLPKNSSNSFLKNVGIKPVTSSNSAALKESELRERLAAEAKTAVQGEIEELKKKSEEAQEKLESTQREMEEMRKQAEINQKTLDENNALLRRILCLNSPSST